MSIRYPNASYPTAYDEDNMVKATDVPVNDAAENLTVTAAGAGMGPLMESTAVTGADVKGTRVHDSDVKQPKVEEPKPAPAVAPVPEVPAGDDL